MIRVTIQTELLLTRVGGDNTSQRWIFDTKQTKTHTGRGRDGKQKTITLQAEIRHVEAETRPYTMSLAKYGHAE